VASVEVVGDPEVVKVIARGPAGPAATGAGPLNNFTFDNPGNDTTPTSGSVKLSWVVNPSFPASGQGGPNPFNLTDPTHPVVLADGNYSITAQVNLAMQGGDTGDWFAGFEINPAGDDLTFSWRRKLPALGGFDCVVLSNTFLAAGTVIDCFLGTSIGSARDCWLTAHVGWIAT